MTLPREPIRYVDPSEAIDESSAPQYLAGALFGAGILFLMALFVFSTDHMLHGWWWGLCAIPAVFVAGAIAAMVTAIDLYR